MNPGEIVFADFDGIVTVPRQVEKTFLELSVEKVSKENESRKELMEGKKLREVYNKYKVL